MKFNNRIYYSVLESTIYLIDGKEEIALIDTGWIKRVPEHLRVFQKDGLDIEKIGKVIVSHAHCDHVGGLSLVKEKFHAVVYAHILAAPYLEKGEELSLAARLATADFYEPCPACSIEVKLKDKDIIIVGDLQLEVVHTPGHTPGSIALKLEDYLFVGDTIFPDGGIGWIDVHWGSNPEDYLESLRLIRSLKPQFILPAHGLPFRFEEEIFDKAIKRVEFYLDPANGLGLPRAKRARDLLRDLRY